MSHYNVVAIDLAKTVFQVCIISINGKVIFNRTMSRSKLKAWLANQPKSLVAMESCGGSNYWARFATALGHEVKVLPPRQVKAFRTGQKTDANDAVAIAIASRAPNIKAARCLTVEQQGLQSIEKMRELLNKQRLQLTNQVRGLLLEFGIVIKQGRTAFQSRVPEILEDAENDLPIAMRQSLFQLWEFHAVLESEYDQLDKRIRELINQDDQCQRLIALEGIGPISAIKLKLQLAQEHFRNGRQAAACIGLTPQQHSSGGKVRIGAIRKVSCDQSLRSTLFLGARSVVSKLKNRPAKTEKEEWLKGLIERRGVNCASIALANKNVRTAFALLKHSSDYEAVSIMA